MQFKHPEILYALLLLIIPIIVHLFQLRKFKKVAFTNVKFLKELTIQTRKSSQLKKWLTLLTRLLMLTAIILAFAQPYISNSESFNTKSETVIYLDNSYSMQAQGNNGSLLNKAVQELIENIDENESISIFTNDVSFKKTSIKAIKNDLIQLGYASKQLDYNATVLKGQNMFSDDQSSVKNLVLISDFQQKSGNLGFPTDSTISLKLVKLQPENRSNISIDSIYISKSTIENLELTVLIKNQGEEIETLPVSLFNDENLIAKSAVSIGSEAKSVFTIPANVMFNGKVSIDDPNLQYDNELFFNIDKPEKIKVLVINENEDTFLKKIFTEDEFIYTSSSFNTLNYNLIDDQNLIVLNELENIPVALNTALNAFSKDGGNILIIPSINISLNSYNQFFNNYYLSNFNTLVNQEKKITAINFSHPLLTNVFDKQVQNFQYPKVNSFYRTNSHSDTSILDFEDGSTFLSESQNTYRFTAPLNDVNSNFKNSPLIVPVIYNIGKQSLKVPQLYYTIGEENKIDISTSLQQDDILTLVYNDNSVIPLQQTFTNKVRLTVSDYPKVSGIASVQNKATFLKHLSFNYNREESNLNYYDISNFEGVTSYDTVSKTLSEIKSATNVNELWKWFVIFALAFLCIEMLILKYLK
ncbi:BatA domain-containing protein [Psychroserpens sp. XS_ASV72]|uniref:BatA domain-containing protein n=1 Tax=Psychroserpens sp. XS_ASV72 TaxID=3241293 RepID=UPI003515728D